MGLSDNRLIIHNSDLGTFNNCEVLFYKTFIQGFRPLGNKYTAFGCAIHTSLDRFYDHFSVLKMKEDFDAEFKKELKLAGVTLSDLDYYNFMTESKQMFDNFYNLELSKDRLKYVEKREIQFSFNYKNIQNVDVVFEGRIDRISDECVWDYKTSRKKFYIDRTDSQMVIYSLAYQSMYNVMPNNGIFIFLKGGVEYPFPVSQYCFDLLDGKVNKVLNLLLTKRAPVPNHNYCYSCGLRLTCEHKKQVANKTKTKIYIRNKAISDLESLF